MDLHLKGRAAIVTGASKGIGKAIARAFAEEGVNLALLARTGTTLEAAAAEIRKAAGTRELAPLHILVNNAGGPIKRPERQITWPDADWRDDIDTKTLGMLRITRAV